MTSPIHQKSAAPLPITPDDPLPTDPRAVVEAFLAALAQPNMTVASALIAEEIVYVNVGMPTLRGRDRVTKVLGGLNRPGFSFEVYLHAISADGGTVLTERTDVLVLGPVRMQFWVAGRFDVVDGEITLWRDAFDYVDILRSTLRGLLGAVVPALRPAAPASADTPPGKRPLR
ncbi:limonene-1,2-epoxide hydrolase family protein [Jatrophihabitans sp.]|uniref:limonene-1,2-epoxide hydrolase family protein n=1 Tax=Jatrophihabitans sp. TaxID=1932789 RepID=UPI0030C7243C|nr:limonene,2-epoxide hydrolase [Jatrophihabitans sp.]